MNQLMKLVLLPALVAVVAANQACFDKTQISPLNASELGASSAHFAFDLFKKVLSQPSESPDDSIFISPISVWAALTSTYLGCGGKTQDELGAALNLSGVDPAVTTDGYKNLVANHLTHTATDAANYTFRLADRLYFEQTVPIRLTCINDQLSDSIQKVNFVGEPQESRLLINNWVANQTNNKILDLLPATHVTPQTSMVIVNAAYFAGSWEDKFIESRTKSDRDFFVRPGKTMKVRMMTRDGSYRMRASDPTHPYAALELPYSGEDVSMIVVLPDSEANITDVVAKLDSPAAFNELYTGMQMADVAVEIPKFRVEQTLELKETVSMMGVKDLFDPTAANMTGFTDASGNYVNFIRHKTYIDVNEAGTEAAAATAVGITRLSAVIRPDILKFVVDRPFLIFIRNNKLDVILFVGYIKTPNQN